MEKNELTKSIDSLIDEVFGPIKKAGENFEVAHASKTTADAAISSAPAGEKDEARGAGRPKMDSDVPQHDTDGSRAKGYESVQKEEGEEENKEVSQVHNVTQISPEGRLAEAKHMKDPRLSKSITEEEYAEFQAFKKAQKAQEDIKKSEDLKKAQADLLKSVVEQAISPLKKENDELRKSFKEQADLIKAMAAQPRQPKSITGIDAIEKSMRPEDQGPREFTKAEKMDAAESLVKAKKIPMEVAIELENTGTVYHPQYRKLIEQELEKQN